jgi:NAD(P)-dependent dehydrogenase (short-subunit alcohol dehydrogenase family)
MRLAGKTALITGGNSGIGLTTARLFVAEGARVAITGRNQATLEAAAKELGPNALAIVADATDIAATEKAVAQVAEKFGKLDIVFATSPTILRWVEHRLKHSKLCSKPTSPPCSSLCRRQYPISKTAPRSY